MISFAIRLVARMFPYCHHIIEDEFMKRILFIAAIGLLFVSFDSSAEAQQRRFGRNFRNRVTRQVRPNYTSNYRYGNRSTSRSTSTPWYINSEPAFRSQRNIILLQFSGYPNFNGP